MINQPIIQTALIVKKIARLPNLSAIGPDKKQPMGIDSDAILAKNL